MFFADLRHCGLIAHIGLDLANTTPTVSPAVNGQRVSAAVQFTATNLTFHDVVSPSDAMTAIGRLPKSSRPSQLFLSEGAGDLPTFDRGVELRDHGAEPAVQELRNTHRASAAG